MKFAKHFSIVMALSFQSCLLIPRPHLPKEMTFSEFEEVVSGARRTLYSGSDSNYHYFAQSRFVTGLGIPISRSSHLKMHKISRNDLKLEEEMARTRDMDLWKSLREVGLEFQQIY